jgi:hypothetical protein
LLNPLHLGWGKPQHGFAQRYYIKLVCHNFLRRTLKVKRRTLNV